MLFLLLLRCQQYLNNKGDALMTKKQKSLRVIISKYKYLYIMLLPCVVYFIVFKYIPMSGMLLGFKEFSFTKGILTSPWTGNYGFKYFIEFFQYYDLGNVIRSTFITGLIKSVFAFPFPIILALMLNEVRNKACKKTIQTISYMPYFISMTVVATMIFRIFAPDDGLVNQIKGLIGLNTDTFYMMEENFFYPILFGSGLWKNIGWNSIIYIAAISGVDPLLYDASSIDGAGRLRQTWHVTLASIKPTMGILFILSVGAILSVGYEHSYLLRTPGNMRLADIISVHVIREGFERGRYSYSTAVGILQSVVSLIMIVTANKLSNKYLEVGIW